MKPYTLLAMSVLATASSFANAELRFSETIRPAVIKTQVNPNIERFSIPATPNNMKLPTFGQGLIGWGSGPEGAEARLNNVTKNDVKVMQQQGLRLDMAQAWQAFYENETQRNPSNPTAPFRAELMKKIVSLW